MKKIVVIGANSYIARNLIFYLKKNMPECELVLYDRASTQADGEKNYHCIDILDRVSCRQLDLNCDAIFMFIGKTGSANGFEEYDTFIDVNERALLNLLDAYRRRGSAAKIIFPSTRLVYKGKPGRRKEDDEKEFKTVYAINKYACEQYLEQFNRVYGIRYCIFRICIPYGTMIPGASSYGTAEFMISKADKGENISLYGDGSVRRTLTYIGDLCRAMVLGAGSPACENEVFNVGGEDYSLREMAECIAAKYGVGVDYVPWPDIAYKIESGDTVFDDGRLKKVLGIEYEQRFSNWCMGL